METWTSSSCLSISILLLFRQGFSQNYWQIHSFFTMVNIFDRKHNFIKINKKSLSKQSNYHFCKKKLLPINRRSFYKIKQFSCIN